MEWGWAATEDLDRAPCPRCGCLWHLISQPLRPCSIQWHFCSPKSRLRSIHHREFFFTFVGRCAAVIRCADREPVQAIWVDSSSAATMSTNDSRAGETAIAEDGLRVWSCITCRRRKVRCDRRDPCSNCVKNQVECHFPVTGRLPRRRDPTAWKSPTEKQAELLDRLRRLESLVTELAAQVEDGPDKIQTLFPGPLTSATGVIHSAEAINAEVEKRGLPNLESPMAAGEVIPAMKSSFQGEMNEDFGRLIVGKEAGLQIGKGFWTIFCNEVRLNF